MTHHYQDLIHIFNDCFAKEYNTILVKGDDEPLYMPANPSCPYHAIYFAHGFYSSALHECAHWFIAGEERRLSVDYGYWYEPDGRTAEQQSLFFKVEVKPQALEWMLSDAARYRFHFSVDNLSGVNAEDIETFKHNVYHQVLEYKKYGLPGRARKFYEALRIFYCHLG